MKRPLIGLAAASALLLALPSTAQQAPAPGAQEELDELIEIVRKEVRSGKSELIEQNMELDAAQAATFWPVYEQLEKERKRLADERLAIIKDYAEHHQSLSDDKAAELLERALDNDAALIALDRKYMNQFLKVLPAKTVARFYQVDRRINLLLDLEVSGQIPLVW